MSYEQQYIDPYQVRARTGTLITCDSAAKQILLHIDGQRDGTSKFVVEDIDETHVLIQTRYLEEVRQLLNEELEKNTYDEPEEERKRLERKRRKAAAS